MIIGVTGKIGSGKTKFSTMLTDSLKRIVSLSDSIHINADTIAHQILEEDLEILENRILNIPRSMWANNKQTLAFLEHYVASHMLPAVYAIEAQNKIVVFDAPLLIELNLHKICDLIIIVDCDYNTRLTRTINRDKRTIESFNHLDSMQYSLEIKTQIAPNAIVTYNNDSDDLKSQVTTLTDYIKEMK